MRRAPRLHAIIGQHRVEGRALSDHGTRDAPDEIRRAEIEQRRSCHEIRPTIDHGLEILHEIRLAEAHGDCAPLFLERDRLAILRDLVRPREQR